MWLAMLTLIDILNLWSSRAEIARVLGLESEKVHDFYRRGGHPAKFDLILLNDAQIRGLPLTLAQFSNARAKLNIVGKMPSQVASRE
jgi:hypothetical protein